MPLLKKFAAKFDQLMQKYMRRLHTHFKNNDISTDMFSSQWFLTLFAYFMPFDFLLRVWDIFMLEGVTIIFTVGLYLLKFQEEEMLQMGFENIMTRMREIKSSGVFQCSPDQFISNALRSFKIKPSTLNRSGRNEASA